MGAINAAIGNSGGNIAAATGSLRGLSDSDLQSKLDKYSKIGSKNAMFGRAFGGRIKQYQSEIDRRSSAANAASAVGDLQGGMGDLGTRVSDLETKVGEFTSDPNSIESAIQDPVAEKPMPTVGAPTPETSITASRVTNNKSKPMIAAPSPFSPIAQKSANAVYGGELERNRSLKR